jgi:hypothetical protein
MAVEGGLPFLYFHALCIRIADPPRSASYGGSESSAY